MRTSVGHYAWDDSLSPQGKAALEHVKHLSDKPILDLGVGDGRTVAALREISEDYVGLDYVNEIVVECQRKFPRCSF